MSNIERYGSGPRWSDVVVHNGVAKWVEVAADPELDIAGQIGQVFEQIDQTLSQLQSRREQVLEVMIFLADLGDAKVLNAQWDKWVVPGHAPIRACVGAALSGGLKIEVVVTAAVDR